MKKVHKRVYCSRCGDAIPPEELAMLVGSTCALCSHMQFEALQIWADKQQLKSHRLLSNATGLMGFNSR